MGNSIQGAQVQAMKLSDQKGQSLDPLLLILTQGLAAKRTVSLWVETVVFLNYH